MKFIIVDDCKTFREGIKYFLENILSHEVVGMAQNGEEFLQMKNIRKADMILMDIEMPVISGVEAAKRALREHKSLKFIATTSYKDKAYLTDLIYAGFKACIFKDNFYDEFEEAISYVNNNKLCFPNGINFEHKKKINNK